MIGENSATPTYHFQYSRPSFPPRAVPHPHPLATSPPLIQTSSHLIRISPLLIWTSSHLISSERELLKIKREQVKNKRAEFHADCEWNSRLIGIYLRKLGRNLSPRFTNDLCVSGLLTFARIACSQSTYTSLANIALYEHINCKKFWQKGCLRRCMN